MEKIKIFLNLFVFLFSFSVFAAGGFEKPVLWSAKAAQRGGAYTSSVVGAEALYFNPAGLIQDEKKEFSGALSVASNTLGAAIIEDNNEVTNTPLPVTPIAILYAQQIDSNSAFGLGLYTIGGLNVGFDNVNLAALGSEFTSFKPDAFAKMMMMEVGLGYSRKLNSNLSFGVTLRADYVRADIGDIQVIRLPDNTVLGVSEVAFEEMDSFNLGAFILGLKYISDDEKTGFGLNYRSKLNIDLRGDGSGKLVYSNAGATMTGLNPGQIYDMKGSRTDFSTSLPEALTFSFHRKVTEKNTLHLEYTWSEYSNNEAMRIDGTMTDPLGNTVQVPDQIFKWHDMHDFKIGWTNTSIEKWILGGGYVFTLPVTNRKYAGSTNAAPGNFHHFYFGAGRMFDNFRIDGAAEYYEGSGKGASAALQNPDGSVINSVEGVSSAKAYAVTFAGSYFF